MTASNYDASLTRVLKHEGGFANHPSDPGGATNFGITIATYARFKGRAVTVAEVRAMPLADAKAIYKADYWNALRCDELPAGLDYALFDYGVNSGIARAAKVLQRLIGQTVGSTISDATIAAVRSNNPADLIARICDERLAFLKSLKTWPVFGAGWGRRVAEVRRDALAMAKGDALAPSTSTTVAGKGSVPAPTAARATTTAATIATGGALAQVFHGLGAPISIVAMTIGIALVLAIAGWVGWTWWHKRRQEAVAVSDARRMDRLRQSLKGWRTVIFGGAITLAGVALDILSALQLVDITPLLPPEHALKIITALGLVTVVLRAVTTGRIGQRDC